VGKLGDERFYVELEAETERLAAAVRDADLTRQVPSCPEWTLGDLVAHVARAHYWVATLVEQRAMTLVPNSVADHLQVPDDPDERSAWLVDGARRMGAAIRDLGPRNEVWTWATDKTGGFWLRRITHDTLVHRLDAELTVGREITLAADLAADSITDLFEVFTSEAMQHFRPAMRELCAGGETLHFHATDDGLAEAGEWLAYGTPSGLVWEHRHGRGDVAVRGGAADLLLVLSRRVPPADGRVEVLGDEKLFARWLEHTKF
jgi:uncharacterized protein (TIGR03083 family)